MDMDKFERKNATHNLFCRHAVGTHGRDYCMDCIILGKTKNGKIKIVVFGERNWKGHDDKKRIRYVDNYRISEKKKRKEESSQ